MIVSKFDMFRYDLIHIHIYIYIYIYIYISSAAHYSATVLTEVCFPECVILEALEDHLIVHFEGFGATFTQKVQK